MAKALKIFGVKLKDEGKLLQSQSGGAFTLIAEYFLEQGAVIYGVGQDANNDAVYMRAESLDELTNLKGSKYVQAQLGETYNSVKDDLANDRIVLFSGTPCCVQAMKLFAENLRNKENLYTVDLICHGVPSPKVYHQYLNYLEEQAGAKVKTFIFRKKIVGGWIKYLEKIIYENGNEEYREEYTQLFYTNLPIRPSCGVCKFSNMDRVGDFTVGDYWGVSKVFPEFNDDKGVSLIFCNTNCALNIFEMVKDRVEYVETDEKRAALQHNLIKSSEIPKHSKEFWKDFNNKGIKYCIKHWSPIGGYPFKIKRKLLKFLKIW